MLFYEIEEIKRPATLLKRPFEANSLGLHSNKLLLWDATNKSNTKSFKEVFKIHPQVGMMEDSRRELLNGNSVAEERSPFSGVKYFESARQSNSKSMEGSKDVNTMQNNTAIANPESKCSNSAFSFNELKTNGADRTNDGVKQDLNDKSFNLNSNKSFRSKSEQGVEQLYKEINKLLPEQSTFFSKLTEGGYSPNKLSNISKIQIKKKNTATFGDSDGRKSPTATNDIKTPTATQNNPTQESATVSKSQENSLKVKDNKTMTEDKIAIEDES